jgi:hypothetical protein
MPNASRRSTAKAGASSQPVGTPSADALAEETTGADAAHAFFISPSTQCGRQRTPRSAAQRSTGSATGRELYTPTLPGALDEGGEQATRYRGVTAARNMTHPWQARCRLNGKKRNLGVFKTAVEAALAYDDFARAHGKTHLNFGSAETAPASLAKMQVIASDEPPRRRAHGSASADKRDQPALCVAGPHRDAERTELIKQPSDSRSHGGSFRELTSLVPTHVLTMDAEPLSRTRSTTTSVRHARRPNGQSSAHPGVGAVEPVEASGGGSERKRKSIEAIDAPSDPAGSRTAYRGVRFDNRGRSKPWSARCTIGGKKHFLGPYNSEKEAARAFDAFLMRRCGREPVNFPDGWRRVGAISLIDGKQVDLGWVDSDAAEAELRLKFELDTYAKVNKTKRDFVAARCLVDIRQSAWC